MKKCPFCAEEIQNDAIKCRYCGESLVNKKNKKGSWAWVLIPLFVFLGISIFSNFKEITNKFFFDNKEKVKKEIVIKEKNLDLSENIFYCFNKESGSSYKTKSTQGCGKNITLTNIQFEDPEYIKILSKKYKPKEAKFSGSQDPNPKITHCLYANGEIFDNKNICTSSVNNDTIVEITPWDFTGIRDGHRDWITVFIRNGGDSSKIVKNDLKVIAELQKQILEAIKNSDAINIETNDLVNSIKRTKDRKILACILGGNFKLSNIIEFIEDCY